MLTFIAIMLVFIFLAVIGKDGRRIALVLFGILFATGQAMHFFQTAHDWDIPQMLGLLCWIGLLPTFILLTVYVGRRLTREEASQVSPDPARLPSSRD